jgi:Carboxypeptidase regulatory-like domain
MRACLLSLAVAIAVAGCGSSSSKGSPSPTATPQLTPGRLPTARPVATFTPIPLSDYSATIHGTITDSKTGSPIPGVLVSVSGGAKTAHTDAFGGYRVAFPAGASAPVVVTVNGFTGGLAVGRLKRHQSATVNFKLVPIVSGTPTVPPPPFTFGG